MMKLYLTLLLLIKKLSKLITNGTFPKSKSQILE